MKDYIFIDTNIFVSDKFNIDTVPFKLIKKYVDKEVFGVITTYIAKEEQLNHINIFKDETVASFKKIYSNRAVLRNVELLTTGNHKDNIDFFSKIIDEKYIEMFNSYLESINVFEIPMTKNSKIIFEKYFNELPPFEANKDKKSEFPDAFMVQSIIDWVDEKDCSVSVISGDKGFISMTKDSPKLLAFENLKDFFKYLSKKNDQYYYEVMETLLNETDDVYDFIKGKLSELEVLDELTEKLKILTDEFSMYDLDTLDLVEINITDFDDSDIVFNIIDIESEEEIVNFQINIEVSTELTGQFEIEDFNNGIYDSEEREYLYIPTKKLNFIEYPKLNYLMRLEIPKDRLEIYRVKNSSVIDNIQTIAPEFDDIIVEEYYLVSEEY
ncbi:PIN domain-containing protein [Carnobacterium maltaromaticum]|uniref:PIN domain-containing protein n=1 Tax=Carnobacterium maltaromaticum TaxID=2751 RepID=UPI0039BDAB88